MANNPYVNKVVKGTDTLIDLTADTVTANSLMQGYTAHDASGQPIVGTMSGGGGTEAGTVTQDGDGYLVLDDEAGSSVTVEALSVTQNGTYTAPTGTAYSPVTVNVSGGDTPSGGGSLSDPIRFFDYDGTLVASYSSVPSSLPDVPTHSNLKDGTWNYTLQQLTTQFNSMGACDVGANYMTKSGDTEIDVRFADAARLSPIMSIAVNGTVELDWGDGSSVVTLTGTSLTTRLEPNHTYAEPGDYTIVIHSVSGSWTFYTASSYQVLRKNTSANENRVYTNCIKAIRVGSGITSLTNYSFVYCVSMECITIPTTVTSIGTYPFYYCNSLKFVAIPSGVASVGTYMFNYCGSLSFVSLPIGVTSIGNSAFVNCYSLTSLEIPSGVTSIGNSAFQNCYAIASLEIPSGVTSIGNTAFNGCYSLASLTIPSTVTSIGNSAFSGCYGMKEYHFKSTTPPTLGTTAFASITSDCIIYVPSASLSDYKTAENWSTYASYMVGE